MTEPPRGVINEAIRVALGSPCAKSRRGAALFRPGFGFEVIAGNNAPPVGFACQKPCGPNACREVCVHAEQTVIIAGLFACHRGLGSFDLVHVKVDERGKLAAGGGPSCAQCSKLIVQVNIAGVWLYENQLDSVGYAAAAAWKRYTAVEFHEATLRNRGLLRKCGKYLGDNDATCPQLTCIRDAGHKGDCDNTGRG